MKLALLRFLHLFMAAIVLFSSMGFGLVEHSCSLRGKRVYSVYSDAKIGCGVCQARSVTRAHTTTLQRTDCCQNNTQYSNVDTTSSLSQLLVKFLKTVSEGVGIRIAAVFQTLIGGLAGYVGCPVVSDYESPPLPAGRTRLIYIQSFLI